MLDSRTTAQRWADNVTEFSGSWSFIGWFAALCLGWIAANASGASGVKWDPYPFLFLNWILTVVSTFQSPLILLSQNRQNETDRDHMKDLMSKLETLQRTIDDMRRDGESADRRQA